MNKLILHTEVQNFMEKNWQADIMSVLLNKPMFEGISQKELAEQLESKKKCSDKLPTWFGTSKIYYPNKLNIEQTSSEHTAQYKAELVQGKTLLDLTGGFGVDTYYFSKRFDSVFHCEINQELSEIASHNFKILGQNNITCILGDGIHFLKETPKTFDWIFVDPSRRNDLKGKVFLLEDCLPNLVEHLPLIFQKTKKVLVKTSPLLDIKQGINELNFVKEIHVVAVKNEVKELLYVLEHGFSGRIHIKTINLTPKGTEEFNFELDGELTAHVEFGMPESYLYEPNTAVLKSGGFKSVGKKYNLKKLHAHSHVYTSPDLLDFPGRRFKILDVVPYSRHALKNLKEDQANITVRNFPMSVAEIRKKHKIRDGGEIYLFFTTNLENNLILIQCEKV